MITTTRTIQSDKLLSLLTMAGAMTMLGQGALLEAQGQAMQHDAMVALGLHECGAHQPR